MAANNDLTVQGGVLLIGPTGAGKTPLGQCIEQHGLWGHRCAHFDFGQRLRSVAQGASRPAGLGDSELAVVRQSLATGALLEDHQFAIAAAILQDFIARRGLSPEDRVVLNGLPRHVGQARDVGRVVRVIAVVALECTPDVVRQRISANAGGDRAGRQDDDLQAIARKLEIYRQRTEPLIEHYVAQGCAVHRVAVTVGMRAEDALRALAGGG